MNTTLRRSLFWMDTGTQIMLLLAVLLGAVFQEPFIALIALFLLGAWQLGSALLAGILLRDRVRIIYFFSAVIFLLAGITLMQAFDPWFYPNQEWAYSLVLSFCYLAGAFYFGLHWQRSYRPD